MWANLSIFIHSRCKSLSLRLDSSWGVKSPLLGPYEDPTPQRETEAYFTTENNTAVAVQAGGTAALRCQVYQVGEEEVVRRRWGDGGEVVMVHIGRC